MARFAGKETSAGSQLAGGLLTILAVLVLILVILVLWQPDFAYPLLAPLRLWHPGFSGLGR